MADERDPVQDGDVEERDEADAVVKCREGTFKRIGVTCPTERKVAKRGGVECHKRRRRDGGADPASDYREFLSPLDTDG